MEIAAQHEPDQRRGHRKWEPGGCFNYCLHPPSPVARGEKKSFEGHQVPSCCGSCFHRQHQFPTNSRLSFPSLFSLLFLCPPHARQDSQTPPVLTVHQQRGLKGAPQRPRGMDMAPLEGLKPGGPQPTSSQRASRKDPGTHLGSDGMEHGKFFFLFFFASLPGGEGGEKHSSNSHWAGLRGAADQT